MIDILHEISLHSNALQARGTGLFRAENLIKRSIKAFELLKDNMGRYEKEIDERVASDAFKEIQFIENHRFASLPRQMLLDEIIKNMKKRLVADDHVKAISTEQEKVLELFNLLDQNTWDLEESVVPWVAVSDGLRKRGARCKKSKGGHYLVCQKKVTEAVLVYESKVVTKKKGLHFPNFFPQIMVFSKKKVFSSM